MNKPLFDLRLADRDPGQFNFTEAEAHRRRKQVFFLLFSIRNPPNNHWPGSFGLCISWTLLPLRDLSRGVLLLFTSRVQAIRRALPPSFTSDSFNTLLPALSPTADSDAYDQSQCSYCCALPADQVESVCSRYLAILVLPGLPATPAARNLLGIHSASGPR
jgi:hypothetical protein